MPAETKVQTPEADVTSDAATDVPGDGKVNTVVEPIEKKNGEEATRQANAETTPATASGGATPAASDETKGGRKWTSYISLARRSSKGDKHDASVTVGANGVPLYRFISTMQGHGYPVVATASVEDIETNKREKGGFMQYFGGKVKALAPHKDAGEGGKSAGGRAVVGTTAAGHSPAKVPAYRFISTMQGHGYPVPPVVGPHGDIGIGARMQKGAREVKGRLVNLGQRFGSRKSREMKEENAKPKGHAEDQDTNVHKYRFFSSMQGHGYPAENTGSPGDTSKSETAGPTAKGDTVVTEDATRKEGMEEGHKGSLLQAFTRRLTFKKRKHSHPTIDDDVPAYRFGITTQGHGYPVATPAPADSPVETHKEHKPEEDAPETQINQATEETPAHDTHKEMGRGRRIMRQLTGMWRRPLGSTHEDEVKPDDQHGTHPHMGPTQVAVA